MITDADRALIARLKTDVAWRDALLAEALKDPEIKRAAMAAAIKAIGGGK